MCHLEFHKFFFTRAINYPQHISMNIYLSFHPVVLSLILFVELVILHIEAVNTTCQWLKIAAPFDQAEFQLHYLGNNN